jgi:hypothetical protein
VLSPALLSSALPPAVLPLRPPLCRPSPSTSCFLCIHASSSSLPVLFLSPGGLPRARHGFPERPPAATSSSPWKAQRRALNLYLSRALAPHQPLRPIPPEPLAFLELPIHIPLPPFFFCSDNARHHRGQPPPGILRPNQPSCKLSHCSLMLIDPFLPSNCSPSLVINKCRRRRLRPHCGQHNSSVSTPP